jgi:glutathione S-transferase
MKLYDHPLSGNGYKVRLLLAQLGVPYEYVPVDLAAGEARTPGFLAKNPLGKVHELGDGRTLPESNAILFWLARDTRLWPDDAFDQAAALQWLFFEQRTFMPAVGGARYWLKLHPAALTDAEQAFARDLQRKGRIGLAVLEQRIANHDFLVGGAYSIADISLYAYAHLAHEGGIELEPFPAVRAWLARIRAQPGYVGIERRP